MTDRIDLDDDGTCSECPCRERGGNVMRLSEGLQRALRESANYGRTCLLTEMDARTILQTVAALEADLAIERVATQTADVIAHNFQIDLAACREREGRLEAVANAARHSAANMWNDRDGILDALEALDGHPVRWAGRAVLHPEEADDE